MQFWRRGQGAHSRSNLLTDRLLTHGQSPAVPDMEIVKPAMTSSSDIRVNIMKVELPTAFNTINLPGRR